MRENRPPHRDLSDLEKLKHKIRQRHLKKKYKGLLGEVVCSECGDLENVEIHHPQIIQMPDLFVFLCRECHKLEHACETSGGE
jgi:hypothetical protein